MRTGSGFRFVVAAGRTPFTETGQVGSRSLFIHWAQEMFDQAGLVRESVKWDYEDTHAGADLRCA